MAAVFGGCAAQGTCRRLQRELRAGQRFNRQIERIFQRKPGEARQRDGRNPAVVRDGLGQRDALVRAVRLEREPFAQERKLREHREVGCAQRVVTGVGGSGCQAVQRALANRNEPGEPRGRSAALQRPVHREPARCVLAEGYVFKRRMFIGVEERRALRVRHPGSVGNFRRLVRFHAVQAHLNILGQISFKHGAGRRPVGAQRVRIRAQAGQQRRFLVDRFRAQQRPALLRFQKHARGGEAVAFRRGGAGEKQRSAQRQSRQLLFHSLLLISRRG